MADQEIPYPTPDDANLGQTAPANDEQFDTPGDIPAAETTESDLEDASDDILPGTVPSPTSPSAGSIETQPPIPSPTETMPPEQRMPQPTVPMTTPPSERPTTTPPPSNAPGLKGPEVEVPMPAGLQDLHEHLVSATPDVAVDQAVARGELDKELNEITGAPAARQGFLAKVRGMFGKKDSPKN